jgi:hypothetical protein
LQGYSRRYAWLRLTIVLLGGALTWAAWTYRPSGLGWPVFGGTLMAFTLAVFLHRRLNAGLARFQVWRAIKAEQLARLELAWERLPPRSPAQGAPCPLDIDLDLSGPRSLHQLLDVSVSQQGSRLLLDWLSDPLPDPQQIAGRQQVVRELRPLTRFCDRLQLVFRQASSDLLEGERLLGWLQTAAPTGRLRWALPVSLLFTAANAALFLLHSLGRLPPFWIFTVFAYFVFYNVNAAALGELLEAIVRLDAELGKFQAIFHFFESYPYAGRPHLARLCHPFLQPRERPSQELRKVRLTTAAVGLRSNPVFGLLLNLLLPWDFFFAWLGGRYRGQVARHMALWLETVYQLEALVSLANFAYLNPAYTFPTIASGLAPIFSAEQLGHPLLPPAHKVRNDFHLERLGQIAVITGSNMAGKSTFIKTVGVNLCLACAGGPVDAVRFSAWPFRLHTCIRITDSLSDGFSYFYAEVRCLKRLLELLRSGGPPVLYLIDEIFRGTNNRERLIGSRAYLRALLDKPGAGLLATHDLELAGLAEAHPGVQNYHFRDAVQNGRLVFDYRLRPGPSPTTNALQIMRLEGLPVDG